MSLVLIATAVWGLVFELYFLGGLASTVKFGLNCLSSSSIFFIYRLTEFGLYGDYLCLAGGDCGILLYLAGSDCAATFVYWKVFATPGTTDPLFTVELPGKSLLWTLNTSVFFKVLAWSGEAYKLSRGMSDGTDSLIESSKSSLWSDSTSRMLICSEAFFPLGVSSSESSSKPSCSDSTFPISTFYDITGGLWWSEETALKSSDSVTFPPFSFFKK